MGSGGDLEVAHGIEQERSQNTGMPVRVTPIRVFGSDDIVRAVHAIEQTDDVLVHGDHHVALVQHSELMESSQLSEGRIFRLPGKIISCNVDRHSNTELMLCFLLETGLFHYSYCTQTSPHYLCVQSFKCTRPISSGIVWRDGGLLYVGYYDGFIRVGVVHEDYDDMLLVKRVATNRNNLQSLLMVANEELQRIDEFEGLERGKRADMVAQSKKMTEDLKDKETPSSEDSIEAFDRLKLDFKHHSLRCDRVSQRLSCLRELLSVVQNVTSVNDNLELAIASLENELVNLSKLELLCEEVHKTGSEKLISKSFIAIEEKTLIVQDLLQKAKLYEDQSKKIDWDSEMTKIISSLNGTSEAAKDMRFIITQHVFEHKGDKKDIFTHFVLDSQGRDLTLYCLSGLTTLAVYPRKGKRIASISLDVSFSTKLTCASSMRTAEGVYVADSTNVFPTFFYREKRFLDAGSPLQMPAFDSITSMLVERDSMILGSVTGGVIYLLFDYASKYDHFLMASTFYAQPISNGIVRSIKLLAAGDTLLALHASDSEVVLSERDNDRWHRVTSHTGGAHSLVCTPFCVQQRGAFAVVASKHYVRIKALQYAEESVIGLHDLGESRVEDEQGKQVEVLNVSLDPTMEFRQLPCKLRYAVGYADKAIRTYVALLTGSHEFIISEKFIAQIEPLYHVQQMVCFHGRPMGCYVSCAKTLQIWNDLDRHQQKKLKSERMSLNKLAGNVSSLERVVSARHAYLLIGFTDDRVSIYEEKGNGVVSLVSTVEQWHKTGSDTVVQQIRCRSNSSNGCDQLFIHSLTPKYIVVNLGIVMNSKLVISEHLFKVSHVMSSPTGFEFLPFKNFEFLVFGNGISVEKMSEEQRKRIDSFRNFEF